MTTPQCRSVQDKLVEGGATALQQDPEAQEHLATCDGCFAFLEALTELDEQLSTLPPIDAPDALVQATLAQLQAEGDRAQTAPEAAAVPEAAALIETTEPEPQQEHDPGYWFTESEAEPAEEPAKAPNGHHDDALPKSAPRRAWAAFVEAATALLLGTWRSMKWVGMLAFKTGLGLARLAVMPLAWLWRVTGGHPGRRLVAVLSVMVVVVGAAGLTLVGVRSGMAPEADSIATTKKRRRVSIKPPALPEQELAERAASKGAILDSIDMDDYKKERVVTMPSLGAPAASSAGPDTAGRQRTPRDSVPSGSGFVGEVIKRKPKRLPGSPTVGGHSPSQGLKSHHEAVANQQQGPSSKGRSAPSAQERLKRPPAPPKQASTRSMGEQTRKALSNFGYLHNEALAPAKPQEAQKGAGGKRDIGRSGLSQTLEDAEEREEVAFKDADGDGFAANEPPPPPTDRSLDLARAFLAERDNLDGLSFQSATGYWANTYQPGDPEMRLLQGRLAAITSVAGQPIPELSPPSQPFDAPTTSALGVYLHADRPAISGPTRMLVQVGLQGTPRFSGSRPAMNVGLVLDLTQAPTAEEAAAMRALLHAFEEAKDLGDRFSLLVAGPGGGLVIGADDFRHGPLKVTLDQLLPLGSTRPGAAPAMPLPQAVGVAMQEVMTDDDPTAPLGSSAVIVISPRSLSADLAALEPMAHASAVNGAPVSAIRVGTREGTDDLMKLALAGQGNLRLLTKPGDAEALVEKEITAVARVVARAVRLRIRLAAGVKLVDVLGSYNLDEAEAQKVREAEQSIDKRLSKNLGIQADRGEDEEGIQIVIPAYYAEDSHVILLDVVAEGPGAVADVTVRYKDLVHLRNGVARANLTLPRGDGDTLSPLEANVIKNLINFETYRVLEWAGAKMAADPDFPYWDSRKIVADRLWQTANLITGIQRLVPSLYSDRDLSADGALILAHYQNLLNEDLPYGEASTIADVLRYAGRLKVLPEPRTD